MHEPSLRRRPGTPRWFGEFYPISPAGLGRIGDYAPPLDRKIQVNNPYILMDRAIARRGVGSDGSRRVRNCLALMSQWESLGGGIARVSVYNSSLDGLDYILKGSGLTESKATRWAGDYHELSKFGGSCDVTLSESVCRHMCNRSRSGWRGIGGHETRGTDTASSTVQSGVSKASPCGRVTGPAITVQTPLNS
jgi:hypothetical protein